jgi:hypothetical protein
MGDVAARRFVGRDWKRGHIGDVVRARIVAIEEIEKFDEGDQRPAIMEIERAGDAQINLNVGGAAELVQCGSDSIDLDAIAVVGEGDGEGTRALRLG